MDTFIHQFGSRINGWITGFDRLVFKGMIRPLMFSAGAQMFLGARGILNKNYKAWMLAQSGELIEAVDQYARNTCGAKSIYLPSSNDRKDEIAQKRQQEVGITNGLIGVWSSLKNHTE